MYRVLINITTEDGTNMEIYGYYETETESQLVCDSLEKDGIWCWYELADDDDEDEYDYDYDDCDYEVGFDPYEGCYSFDC